MSLEEELVNEHIREGICPKGNHFPEHIYYWETLRGYVGHCAICGTDYGLRRIIMPDDYTKEDDDCGRS